MRIFLYLVAVFSLFCGGVACDNSDGDDGDNGAGDYGVINGSWNR